MILDVLHNEDCCGRVGIKSLPAHSVDLALTDLPYGSTRNRWDAIIDPDWLFRQYRRILKPDGTVVLFGQGMFTSLMMTAGRDWWRYNLVWDKVSPSGHLNANRMPLRRHEDLMVFSPKQSRYYPQKGTGRRNNSIGKAAGRAVKEACYGARRHVDNRDTLGDSKYPCSVLTFQKPAPSARTHPTEKPVDLLIYLIKTYSRKEELVLDHCAGTGSTLVAAAMCGRHFLGWEKEPAYCNTARRRLGLLHRDADADEAGR